MAEVAPQGGELVINKLSKGAFNSSPVAGNGHVYVSNNDGVTFVVKAGAEFEVVGTNNLGERISMISGVARTSAADVKLYHEPKAPSHSAVEAAVAALDCDALSPREALDALYRLKKLGEKK